MSWTNQDDKNGFTDLSTPSLAPGAVIDGKYEIESFLGKGGMCSVYKSRHLHLERDIALKFLNQGLALDAKAMKRFQSEARAISMLEHPNIVKVFGFGNAAGMPFIAMEFLDGISLSDVLKNEKRLEPGRVLPIFCQILDAMSHAHEKGVIHRDLKPSNIMLVGPEQIVKVVDFGMARIYRESGADMQKLTTTGDIIGTPPYMSPEQCAGEPVNALSDLYSLGCLMYEALDGEQPFSGKTPLETMSKHLNEPPRKSEYLENKSGVVILAAMQKDPMHRPRSAREFKELLENSSDAAAKSIAKAKAGMNFATLPIGRVAISLFLFLGLIAIAYEVLQKPSDLTPRPQKKSVALHKPGVDRKLQQLRQDVERMQQIALNPSKSIALSDAWDRLAKYLEENGDLKEALSARKQQLLIDEKAGVSKTRLGGSADALGIVYKKQGDYENAEKLFLRAVQLRKEIYEPIDMINATMNLAAVEIKIGKTKEAEQNLQEGAAYADKHLGADIIFTARVHGDLARLYRDEGKFSNAEKECRKVIDICSRVDEAKGELSVYQGFLAELKQAQHNKSTTQTKHPLLPEAAKRTEAGAKM